MTPYRCDGPRVVLRACAAPREVTTVRRERGIFSEAATVWMYDCSAVTAPLARAAAVAGLGACALIVIRGSSGSRIDAQGGSFGRRRGRFHGQRGSGPSAHRQRLDDQIGELHVGAHGDRRSHLLAGEQVPEKLRVRGERTASVRVEVRDDRAGRVDQHPCRRHPDRSTAGHATGAGGRGSRGR